MKTFNQFITESKKKSNKHIDKDGYGVGFATIGKHSIPKDELQPMIDKDGYGVGFATIGQHSIPKGKNVKEEEQLTFRFGKSKKKTSLPSNTNRIDGFTPWKSTADYGKAAEHSKTNVTPLHDALSHHFKSFEPEHQKGIDDYTGGSSSLNRSLIRNHTNNQEVPSHHFDTIHRLDSAMSVHKAPADLTTYSGTSHSPENYPVNPETGKRHIKFPAYTSTSIDATTARGFASPDYHLQGSEQKYPGKHVIKFHVPEGHPGMYLENHTAVKGEHEFLLHRGMRAHVDAEPETVQHQGPYDYEPVTTHIWHAHVQPHDGNHAQIVPHDHVPGHKEYDTEDY